MRITRFEDLECWQESRKLTKTIYAYAKRAELKRDFRLADQMTGAALSVMNNICEGFDSKSNSEFIRFLTYSRRSCSEVQNCLYVTLDQRYVSTEEFEDTYRHCGKVRKIIDSLIRYLKKNNQPNRPTGRWANRQTD